MVQKNLWWRQKEKGDMTNGSEKTVVVGTQEMWRLPVASVWLSNMSSLLHGREKLQYYICLLGHSVWPLFMLIGCWGEVFCEGKLTTVGLECYSSCFYLFYFFRDRCSYHYSVLYFLFTGRDFTFAMKGSYEETRDISMGPSCSQRGSDSTMFHYIKYSQPNLDMVLPKERLYCGVCFCLWTLITAKVTFGRSVLN